MSVWFVATYSLNGRGRGCLAKKFAKQGTPGSQTETIKNGSVVSSWRKRHGGGLGGLPSSTSGSLGILVGGMGRRGGNFTSNTSGGRISGCCPHCRRGIRPGGLKDSAALAARWAQGFVKLGGEAWARGSIRGNGEEIPSLARTGLCGLGCQVGAKFRPKWAARRGLGVPSGGFAGGQLRSGFFLKAVRTEPRRSQGGQCCPSCSPSQVKPSSRVCWSGAE